MPEDKRYRISLGTTADTLEGTPVLLPIAAADVLSTKLYGLNNFAAACGRFNYVNCHSHLPAHRDLEPTVAFLTDYVHATPVIVASFDGFCIYAVEHDPEPDLPDYDKYWLACFACGDQSIADYVQLIRLRAMIEAKLIWITDDGHVRLTTLGGQWARKWAADRGWSPE